ncbi:hypothetical protein MKW92_000760 [Papaver armeniacum]|nr:hypothetical protein MKW92_000760 [Papaver armeniacum]
MQTIIAAVEHAGWLGEGEKRLTHVGYGLVFGGDKKELAGSSSALLDKAKRLCREYLDEMDGNKVDKLQMQLAVEQSSTMT